MGLWRRNGWMEHRRKLLGIRPKPAAFPAAVSPSSVSEQGCQGARAGVTELVDPMPKRKILL
jgi:hypothetical protein